MSQDESDSQPARYTRDGDYYMQSAIFLVEDQLFKVPTVHFTRESDVFQAMFQLPQDPNVVQDGSTDEQPIRLDGVKKEDFKQLLRVMYARAFIQEEILSEKEWTSVLVLSARWGMERLQKLSIDKLTPSVAADGHKLVIMGHRYNVKSWLVSGIQLLVLREDPMDEKDVNNIGTTAALKIAAIREWILDCKLLEWGIKFKPRDMSGARKKDLATKIRESFGLGDEN